MIEQIWFGRHPLGLLLWPLLWPLSRLYRFISAKRRKAYSSGDKPSYRSHVPVIVVGNITAGGNGKTPMVVWLVEQLLNQGKKPGVVSRGYGGKASAYPLLVTSDTAASECGDEPKLIFERTQVPVCVDPVRANAVKHLELLGADVIITDDGLQHYALERAYEIVVIDGVRRFGNQQPIPLGPLREPLSRLDEVNLLVVNGGDVEANEREKRFTLAPNVAINLNNGQTASVEQLGTLAAFAGIGHPPRFFDTLSQLGANLVKTQGFADHQAFDETKLAEFSHGVENVIMTEKDAVKCRSFSKDNWWYLPVSAQFNRQDGEQILQEINKVIESYGS